MPSKNQFRHRCRPEDQGTDKNCLACTQEIYYDCRNRHAGIGAPVKGDPTRFTWVDGVLPPELAQDEAEKLAQEYSAGVAATVFRELGVGLRFELSRLRALANPRGKSTTPIVRLKAILAIQDLRREVMRGIRTDDDTPSGGNGTGEPPKPGMAKDDWTGSQ